MMNEQPLDDILSAALAANGAEMGNIQLLNQNGDLQIVASRGFGWRFLSYFDSVHSGQAACGNALRSGARILVEDVSRSRLYDEKSRQIMLDAAARACQSTPLRDETTGQIIGMISTHRRTPGAFEERALFKIEALANHVARKVRELRMQPGSLSWSQARSRILLESTRHLLRAPNLGLSTQET